MKKTIGFSILVIIGCVCLYNYIYQDHRNIESESAEFITNPQKILSEIKLDTPRFEKKYLNKTIEITGSITDVTKSDLTLNNMVFCQFSERQLVELNSNITVKGRCIGYDDLLEQLKLDQCIIIK